MTTTLCAPGAVSRTVAWAILAALLVGCTSRVMAGAADIQLVLGPERPPSIRVAGPPGTVCQVQWSDNLAEPGRWFHLTHCVLTGGCAVVTDPAATTAALRYYRAIRVPSPDLVLIPGSPFVMGDSFGEGNEDERPAHSVDVSAFYMDRCEVSKALWDEVRAWATNTGYAFAYTGSAKATNHPVHTINWYDAVKWCNARSEKEGLTPCYYADTNLTVVYKADDVTNAPSVRWSANGYRLPTEAEWEKAARAGASRHRFPWHDADTITHSRANYYSLASPALPYDVSPTRGYHPAYRSGGQPYTNPCDELPSNPYGLCDMAGNLREWCWDAYAADWYGQRAATQANTPGPPQVLASRVTRGGAWRDNANYSRCADRLDENPFNALNVLGFRCVRRP